MPALVHESGAAVDATPVRVTIHSSAVVRSRATHRRVSGPQVLRRASNMRSLR